MTVLDGVASRSHDDHLTAARRAQREGRVTEAEAEYDAAFAVNPKSSAAALALVRLTDARGDRSRAQEILRTFVAASGTTAALTAAARQWEEWEDSPLPGAQTIRIAVTGAWTLDPLGAHLRVACAQAGLHPVVRVGGFNQWAQDVLSPDSPLYDFAPELIILSLPAAVLFPKAWEDSQADRSALAAERADGLSQVERLLDAAHLHAPRALVVMSTFTLPDRSPLGILDLKVQNGQRACVTALNLALWDLVRDRANVLLLDQDRIEARFGKARVRDPRLWFLGGLPFSEAFLPVLAAEYLRVIRPLKGLVRKCIVLDLDNTLWGGVVGEDGLEGIQLGGTDGPGSAFRDFQLALDALRRRGVLLAVCSRNNPDDAWNAIDSHPHMVLRRDAFAAVRINWADKASNVVEIARELNIGLDSLVFFDDNPSERALVRHHVPEVLTVDLPADPAFYTEVLLNLDVFESLGLTEEDRARGDMYRQAQSRREFERTGGAADLSTHLESLDIAVAIERASSSTIPRVAQLVNKTNQFNLTTQRYPEAEVRAIAEDTGRSIVLTVRVSDRFGDLGLTGVAIVHMDPVTWTIDSFLLSCRVLGRGVEDALLAHIVHRAKTSGARILQGQFRPTAKNAPARNFYETRGFGRVEGLGESDAPELFELPLDSAVIDTSYRRWLRVTTDDGPPAPATI